MDKTQSNQLDLACDALAAIAANKDCPERFRLLAQVTLRDINEIDGLRDDIAARRERFLLENPRP